MSGYLYELRKNWRIHSGPDKTLETPSMSFIRLFGTVATFKHVGIDSTPMGSKRLYHNQMYAVFGTGSKSNDIPLTPLDIESLAVAVKGLAPGYPHREDIQKHMQAELTRATRSLDAHKDTVASLTNAQRGPSRQLG